MSFVLTRSWLPVLFLLAASALSAADEPTNGRKPANDAELKYWLGNMATHGFTPGEQAAALGMSAEEVRQAVEKLRPEVNVAEEGKLRLLPYPGGRHPRIGFLDGAIDPQRESKASVFLPWKDAGYVVVDLPEAIWSNLGLTYLAHTHVPTIWSKQGVQLPPQEWERLKEGSLRLERKLPNGIIYEAKIGLQENVVRMSLTLTNGTKEKLSDLRIQNCVMLKGAPDFNAQTNDNKLFRPPFVAVRDKAGHRWVITAWERCHNAWGNAPCPCLHSDPKFADLEPGATATISGWLWCYAGDDIEGELKRLAK